MNPEIFNALFNFVVGLIITIIAGMSGGVPATLPPVVTTDPAPVVLPTPTPAVTPDVVPEDETVLPEPAINVQLCDPSYPSLCIPIGAGNVLNCKDITERNFEVVGADPQKFDSNHNGVGCELIKKLR